MRGEYFLRKKQAEFGRWLNRPTDLAITSIIANDCWGGRAYQEFGLSYPTPFVGLYLMPPCFLRLIKNFEDGMNSKLHFLQESRYASVNHQRMASAQPHPIGVLPGGIEIQFLHYSSQDEAFEKWNRRRERINYNRLAFKLSAGKDDCTAEICREFDSLPVTRKLLLDAEPHPDLASAVHVRDYDPDGTKMFRRSLKYFDFSEWLKTGAVQKRSLRTVANSLIYAQAE